jgi:hypothetical protein
MVKTNVNSAVNSLIHIMEPMESISYNYKTCIGTVMATYKDEPHFNHLTVEDIVSNTENHSVSSVKLDMFIKKFVELFFELKLRLLGVDLYLMGENSRSTVQISQEVKDKFYLIYKKIKNLYSVFNQNVEY